TFFDTSSSVGGPLDLSKNVRYWSLCLSGLSGETSSCLADSDAIIDTQGKVTVVIGPENLKDKVLSRGLNFIPRGRLFLPILFYRNLLPNHFPEGLKKEYAPKGIYYSEESFLRAYPVSEKITGKGESLRAIQDSFIPPSTDSPKLRLGVSAFFFMGDLWY